MEPFTTSPMCSVEGLQPAMVSKREQHANSNTPLRSNGLHEGRK
jgi:hypothetical protein